MTKTKNNKELTVLVSDVHGINEVTLQDSLSGLCNTWILRCGMNNVIEKNLNSFFKHTRQYVPWPNYFGSETTPDDFVLNLEEWKGSIDEANKILRSVHRDWDSSTNVYKLGCYRLCAQLLGECLDDPLNLVVVYKKEGKNITDSNILISERICGLFNIPYIDTFENLDKLNLFVNESLKQDLIQV